MTSATFATSPYQPLAMCKPFATDGNITPITQQAVTESGVAQGTVNYKDGIPPAYSSSGTYFTRAQMNAIGNLASRLSFFKQAGGVITFDPAFAIACGGYPAGAILKYISGNYIYDVISLVDNNMHDFRGITPTSEQATAGIVAGSIDNEYWQYMNKDVDTESNLLFTVPAVSYFTNSIIQMIPVGMFTAVKNGTLSLNGGVTVNSTYSISDVPNYGIFVVIKETSTTTSPPSSVKYDTIYGTCTYTGSGGMTVGNITYNYTDTIIKTLTRGTQYSVWLLTNGCKFSSTLKGYIT